MSSLPPGHSYDLDPAKAPDQDFEQNQKDLEFVATSFLEIIAVSIPALPSYVRQSLYFLPPLKLITFISMFREICAHIG